MDIPGLPERYSVLRLVGAGGMGEVYEATDEAQGRRVAIKLTAAWASERFAREIEAVARLNHPHIVPLFDSGEADGRSYFVMPFIEGPSLRDALLADGPLSLERALSITREIGSALRYAHSEGIIHRDVKPSNILLSQGKAVLADFGVVGGVRFPGRLTESGSGVGTPAYASPGQMDTTEAPTPASDVYALASVLFEMLAGRPPYAGHSPAVIVAQKISYVPSLRGARHDVPQRLDSVVTRALAASASDRYQTVEEFLAACDEAEARRGGTRRRVIAAALGVMAALVGLMLGRAYDRAPSPVRTLAVHAILTDRDEEDGERIRVLADRIGRGLAMLGGLTVVGPHPPGTAMAPRAEAELSVSMERRDDGTEWFVFRSDLQGPDGAWEQAHRLPPTAVGDLQIPAAVVRSIAPLLQIRPSEQALAEIDETATDDEEAWRLYQVALQLYGRSARLDDRLEAVRLLEEAVELDPAFSEAYAKAGEVLAVAFDFERDPNLVSRAHRHIETALAMDPNLPEGHLAAATLQFVQGGFRQARLSLERALGMGPSRHDAGWLRSVFLRREGRWDAAVESFEELVSWDPGHRVWVLGLGRTLLWLGDYAGAIAAFDRSIALGPDARDAPYLDKAWTLAVAGHGPDSVVAVIREAARVAGRQPVLEVLVAQHAERGWFWWLPPNLVRDLGPVEGDAHDAVDRYLVLSSLGVVAGDRAARRMYADSARMALAPEASGRPTPDIRSKLGIANALAERPEEAVRWAAEGLERRRTFPDAYNGPISLFFLMQTHALNGDRPRTGAYLDSLLAAPSPYSRQLFQERWKLMDLASGEPARSTASE